MRQTAGAEYCPVCWQPTRMEDDDCYSCGHYLSGPLPLNETTLSNAIDRRAAVSNETNPRAAQLVML